MRTAEFPSFSKPPPPQHRDPFAKPPPAPCKPQAVRDRPYFLRDGRLRVVEKDQPLFWHGDEATHIFQTHDGIISLSANLMDGRRQIFRFCFAGDVFGLPVDGAHNCTAAAICTATVSSHPVSILDPTEASEESSVAQMLPAIVRELMLARDQAIILGRKSAPEKVASFLLMLVDRCGREIGDGRFRIPMPMRHADIADYLGVASETVCRFLTDFKRRGAMVAERGGEFIIVDKAYLKLILSCEFCETERDRSPHP